MRRWLCLLFIITPLTLQAYQPLPVNQVFQFSAKATQNQTILTRWHIKSNHYLYKDRFEFKVIEPKNAQIGRILWPKADIKQNKIAAPQAAYSDHLVLKLPITATNGHQNIKLLIRYQGCSTTGYCYPPQTKVVQLNLNQNSRWVAGHDFKPPQTNASEAQSISEQKRLTGLLEHTNALFGFTLFFGFGLLLAFTPCVLPMVPILSSLIVGQKHRRPSQSFLLSLTYVLAMAVTYAVAGVITGFLGNSIQSMMQSPWAISILSGLIVLLAFSLFGVYEIRLPQRWQQRVTEVTNRQTRGTYAGTAGMGILSTLIVSPCVTPPLVGALGYISHTGDAVFGGMALFALGLGMGLPLLIAGTALGQFLPKAGPWMDVIKKAFGFILLGFAIWLLTRILPNIVILWLWAGLLMALGIYLVRVSVRFWKSIGILATAYGLTIGVSSITGYQWPLQPLSQVKLIDTTSTLEKPLFRPVNTMTDIQNALQSAQRKNQPVLLDFSADWCIACKAIEQHVFQNPKVKTALKDFIRLKVDITNPSASQRSVQRHFNVIAPPTLIFISPNGKELENLRIVGDTTVSEFLAHLKQAQTRP